MFGISKEDFTNHYAQIELLQAKLHDPNIDYAIITRREFLRKIQMEDAAQKADKTSEQTQSITKNWVVYPDQTSEPDNTNPRLKKMA